MRKAAYEKLLKEILAEVAGSSHFKESTKYIQHGNTSIYRHSIMVARKSCQIASRFNLDVSYNELVRGALLHYGMTKHISTAGHMVFSMHRQHYGMQCRILCLQILRRILLKSICFR